MGAPAEVLAKWATAQAPGANEEVEVLACNWDIVQVYRLCQWSVIAGMTRAIYHGIPATELLAAMRCVRVRPAQQLHVANGVRVMERAARRVLNR